MKYGIICAMEEEILLLSKDIIIKEKYIVAGRTFLEGTLYDADVILVKSNIGKVASALTVTILIERFCPDNIIFCGTAGGLTEDLNPGDIVIADKLVQHDFFDGVSNFKIPIINITDFKTNTILTNKLEAVVGSYVANDMLNEIPDKYIKEFGITSPKATVGTVASGDQFINDSEKHRWLVSNIPNIKCVEMEGAAVAQVCYEYSIPFAVIRVISDNANNSSNFDFDKFVVEAASHITRDVIKAFLTSI